MRRALSVVILAAAACSAHLRWAYQDGPPSVPQQGQRVAYRLRGSAALEATKAGLADLGTVTLPAGDREVRVWAIPSFGKAFGIVLRKEGDGSHALQIDEKGARELVPTIAWASLWRKLEGEGIFTLPDEAELPRDGVVMADGLTYAVETQIDGVYRSFAYSNPYDHAWAEATSMLRIAHTLARAFRVTIDDRSRYVTWPVPNNKVVLVRRGEDVGAFVMHDQTTDPLSARYDWAWRRGGSGPLDGAGIARGTGVVTGSGRGPVFIRFGPFAIEWEVQGESSTFEADGGTVRCCGIGRLYFDESSNPFGLARTNAASIAGLDPGDSSLTYERARVEYDDP